MKLPAQVLAEQKLMEELDAGIQSAEKQGWVSFEKTTKLLGV